MIRVLAWSIGTGLLGILALAAVDKPALFEAVREARKAQAP